MRQFSIMTLAAALAFTVTGSAMAQAPVQTSPGVARQASAPRPARGMRPLARRAARIRLQRLDVNRDATISRDEWKRKPEVFDQLDANKDGVLTRDELRSAADTARTQRAEDRWKRLDKDGNGSISKEEWPRNQSAFDRLDVNKDGALTPDELRRRTRRR